MQNIAYIKFRVVAIFNLFLFYFKSVLIQQFLIGNKNDKHF